jgi:outer membrane immunogenic protein
MMHIIRTIGLAAGLMLAATTTAWGADLPNQHYGIKDYGEYSGPWQGRYLGVMLGMSGMGADVDGFGLHDKWDVKDGSLSGALVMGYNFRRSHWVGGFEADIGGMAIDKKKNITGLGMLSMESNFSGSLRLRGGYAWERLYLYGTAGLALTHFELKSSQGGDESGIVLTPTIGLGMEYAFNEAWTMRAEALTTGGSFDAKLAGEERDIDFGASTIRVGLTRKF